MWIDEIDVAQRLDILERDLALTDPELVLSFAALAHPSLRARFLTKVAAEEVSPDGSVVVPRPMSIVRRYSVVFLVMWLLLSLSVLLGTIAPVVSAIVLMGATLAVCGLLTAMTILVPRFFVVMFKLLAELSAKPSRQPSGR